VRRRRSELRAASAVASGGVLNPYDPPTADTGRNTHESNGRVRTWARRVGWFNIACAPSFVALVTVYCLLDDSSMAGVLWIWSFPAALVAYALPGLLLMLLPRAGWAFQLLPLALSWYAVQMLQHVLRLTAK
jgi:hypothetical protein